MENVTVSKLKPDMTFTGDLLVRTADRRTGKTGRDYLDFTLCDATGEINAKLWNVDGMNWMPVAGQVISVESGIESFNGRIQMRINRIRPATNPDMRLLVPSAPESPEAMRALIDETVASFESEDLRRLVLELIAMAGDRLNYFPAAQRMHHAEYAGLLHHTTGMLKMAEDVCRRYPFLNRDLLLAGVIVHDLCKTEEMQSDAFGSVSDYTADGILIGHLVRGVAWVEEAARKTGVTGEIVLLMQHMMLSHHGEPAFGSPKLPMFPEAEALHWIDSLDARMNEMQTIQERTPAGAFSERIAYLDDRRMYHPRFPAPDQP